MKQKIRLNELETPVFSNSSEFSDTADPVVLGSLAIIAAVSVATWVID